jgi:hypothetical protein
MVFDNNNSTNINCNEFNSKDLNRYYNPVFAYADDTSCCSDSEYPESVYSDVECHMPDSDEAFSIYPSYFWIDDAPEKKKKIVAPFVWCFLTEKVLTPSAVLEEKISLQTPSSNLVSALERLKQEKSEWDLRLCNLPRFSAAYKDRLLEQENAKKELDLISETARIQSLENIKKINSDTQRSGINQRRVFRSNVKTVSVQVVNQRRKEKKKEKKEEKQKMVEQNRINNERLILAIETEKKQKKEDEERCKQAYLDRLEKNTLSAGEQIMAENMFVVFNSMDKLKDIEIAAEVAIEKKEKKVVLCKLQSAGWNLISFAKKEYNESPRVKYLCDSIVKNTVCRHGDKCNFSHVITSCPYDKKCLNVVCNESIYYNKTGSRKCTFIHANESMENFKSRISILSVSAKPDQVTIKAESVADIISVESIIWASGSEVRQNMSWADVASTGIDKSNWVANSPVFSPQEEVILLPASDIKNQPDINKKTKTHMCRSISGGQSCKFGTKCMFAHSALELDILECQYGERCNKIKRELNGQICNAGGVVCGRKHGDETSEEVKYRLFGASPVVAEVIKVAEVVKVAEVIKVAEVVKVAEVIKVAEVVKVAEVIKVAEVVKMVGVNSWNTNAKVKLCKSVNDCKFGSNCRFAHAVVDLECGYGTCCKKIQVTQTGYINTGNKKCDRKHPGETTQSLVNRMK